MMLAFLAANWGSLVVCAVLLLVVTAIIAWMVRNHKKGKSSTGGCGCGCENCAMSEHCHPKSK